MMTEYYFGVNYYFKALSSGLLRAFFLVCPNERLHLFRQTQCPQINAIWKSAQWNTHNRTFGPRWEHTQKHTARTKKVFESAEQKRGQRDVHEKCSGNASILKLNNAFTQSHEKCTETLAHCWLPFSSAQSVCCHRYLLKTAAVTNCGAWHRMHYVWKRWWIVRRNTKLSLQPSY